MRGGAWCVPVSRVLTLGGHPVLCFAIHMLCRPYRRNRVRGSGLARETAPAGEKRGARTRKAGIRAAGRRRAGGDAFRRSGGAGAERHGLRGSEPCKRARRDQRRLDRRDRQAAVIVPMPQARRSLARSRRARRPTSSSRPTSTGWTISSEREPDPARHRDKPARQPHRADRARRFRCRHRDRAGLRPRRAARPDGRLAMANVDAVPAGRYGKAALESARRLGHASPGRIAQAENVRAALALVATRRGAARHRLPDRRGGRTGGEDRRPLSRGHAIRRSSIPWRAGRGHRHPTPTPSGVPASTQAQRRSSRPRGSRSWRRPRRPTRTLLAERMEWLRLTSGRMDRGPPLDPGLDLGDDRQPALRYPGRPVLARREFPGKAVLNGLVHLPLVLPPVVTGYLLLAHLRPPRADRRLSRRAFRHRLRLPLDRRGARLRGSWAFR